MSSLVVRGGAMAGISAFRSEDARAAYCRLYDDAVAASPVPVSEADIETSYGRVHVLTAGDPSNPPLVALHGMSFSSTSWLPLLSTLAADYHVTMVDTLGEVNKSIATKPITKDVDVIAWLDETLRALSIGQATFVGLSMGSWIATNFAMAHTDRVERLALISPAGLVCNQHPRWLLQTMLTVAVRPTEPKVESMLDKMAMPASYARLRQSPWQPIVRQFVAGMLTFRMAYIAVRPLRCNLQRLAETDVPILAMIGADETLHDGPTFAARLSERVPSAQVELVRGANHLLPVDQPEIVEGLLAEFLA